MTANMSRHAARNLMIAMMAVVVVGVVGVGALALSGEAGLPEPPQPVTHTEREPETADNTEVKPKLDIAMVSEDIEWAFSEAYPWTLPQEEETETPGDDRTATQPMNQASPLRYIGSIIGPERRLAIVSIDGRQRILAQNASIDGYTLQRVEDDHIIVRRGAGSAMQVDKADAVGPMMTTIAGKPQSPGQPVRGVEEEFDNMDRAERYRQQALDRQRDAARNERLQQIENQRNGAAVKGLAQPRNNNENGAVRRNTGARPATGTTGGTTGTAGATTGDDT